MEYLFFSHATICSCTFSQVYEKRPVISGGEGTLISIFPNGCRALNEANAEIVAKVFFPLCCRVFDGFMPFHENNF